MKRIRVIPVLLLKDDGLVKTVKFKNPNYIGDPINAVKIFNEKEVDELVFLDIQATRSSKTPDYKKIEEIAYECFMPLAYGGGIQTIDQIKRIFGIGVEKVIINSASSNSDMISEAAGIFGSQSIVASVDIKKDFLGKYHIYTHSGKKKQKEKIEEYVSVLENSGFGELIITSIDKEGTFSGYDTDLIRRVTEIVNIPVVANGGAGSVSDYYTAVNSGGASAVAAGSMFVYKSKNRGVLINYPSQEELKKGFFDKLD